jgi:hypothetical protein
MGTTEKTTDKDALLEHITIGKPLDPEVRRRILERGERISEQLRQMYGEMDIAVDLIRERVTSHERACIRFIGRIEVVPAGASRR